MHFNLMHPPMAKPKHRIRTKQQLEEAAAQKNSQRRSTRAGAASGSGLVPLLDLDSRLWIPDLDDRTRRRDWDEETVKRRAGDVEEEAEEDDDDDDGIVPDGYVEHASSSEEGVPTGRRIRKRGRSDDSAEEQEASVAPPAKKSCSTKPRLRKRDRSVEPVEEEDAPPTPPTKKARPTKKTPRPVKRRRLRRKIGDSDADFIDDKGKKGQVDDSASYEGSSEDEDEGEENEGSDDEDVEGETFSILNEDAQEEEEAVVVVKKRVQAAVEEKEGTPKAEDPLKRKLALVSDNPYQFIVRQLILEAHDVLIIGENERYSMTLALAAMRKSFGGIWCSRTDAADFRPMQMHELLMDNYASALSEFGHPGCESCENNLARGLWKDRLQAELLKLTQLDLARLDLNFWAHQVNQPSSPYRGVPKHLVWLLPPTSTKELKGQEAGYLQSAMLDCYHVQWEGDVVLITLNEEETAKKRFDVKGLVKFAKSLGYKHWTDDAFVRDNCQHNGYHPQQDQRNGKGRGATATWRTHIFMKVVKEASLPPQRSWIKADTLLLPREPPRPHASITVPIPASAPSEPQSPGVPATLFKRSRALSPECLPPSAALPTPPTTLKKEKVRKSPRKHPTAPNPAYIDVLPSSGVDDLVSEPESEPATNKHRRALSPEYPPPSLSSTPSPAPERRKGRNVRKVRKSPRGHPTGPNLAYIDILPGSEADEEEEMEG